MIVARSVIVIGTPLMCKSDLEQEIRFRIDHIEMIRSYDVMCVDDEVDIAVVCDETELTSSACNNMLIVELMCALRDLYSGELIIEFAH